MEKRIEISYQQLSKEALQGAIEEFVLRESAESGYSETSLNEKVARVRAFLEAGKAKIVFTPSSKTHNIIKCDH